MIEISGILIGLFGLAFLILGGFFAAKLVDLLPKTFQNSRLAIYDARFRKTGVAMLIIGAFISTSQWPIYNP